MGQTGILMLLVGLSMLTGSMGRKNHIMYSDCSGELLRLFHKK